MSFQSLGLCDALLKNVRLSGYTDPTPIQRETIPLVLAGRDVLGCAQTGTGKTAAFALPILQRLKEMPSARPDVRMIRALILSPTRELAQQTYDNFLLYGKGLGLTSCVLFGGVSQVHQTEALHEGADIVVACPGRLLDLMGQGLVRLEGLDIFVLDEADRMLDMGFIHDVRRVIKALPDQRQSLFFSATMPPAVEKLAMDILKNPETVKVDPVTSTVDAIDQCLYYVDKPNKRHLLAHLLKSEDPESVLVFSRTKHGVDRIVRELKRAGIDAEGIHGDKSQGARQNALNRFKGGKCHVLVATDIAARGIDIEGLSHVINYDLPNEPESYIHRIGRTGRAGRSGKAISFCCIDEAKQLHQIEKLIGKRLREEKSGWPMENCTPSPPKDPGSRSSKSCMNGETAPASAKRPASAGNAPAAAKRPASAGNAPAPSAGRDAHRRAADPAAGANPASGIRTAIIPERPYVRWPQKVESPSVRGPQKPERPSVRMPQKAEKDSGSGSESLGTPLYDTSSLFSFEDGWEAFRAAYRR
ncbi:MAG: DEAD/DEAH box helicase [Clostridia bacterium]|nr:DEAD/DEAH box helicase [Clostridia bacterium]